MFLACEDSNNQGIHKDIDRIDMFLACEDFNITLLPQSFDPSISLSIEIKQIWCARSYMGDYNFPRVGVIIIMLIYLG